MDYFVITGKGLAYLEAGAPTVSLIASVDPAEILGMGELLADDGWPERWPTCPRCEIPVAEAGECADCLADAARYELRRAS